MAPESWKLLGKSVISDSFDEALEDYQDMCMVFKREKAEV